MIEVLTHRVNASTPWACAGGADGMQVTLLQDATV